MFPVSFSKKQRPGRNLKARYSVQRGEKSCTNRLCAFCNREAMCPAIQQVDIGRTAAMQMDGTLGRGPRDGTSRDGANLRLPT